LKSRGTNIKPTLFWFSADIEAVLKRRPAVGQLFPYLCRAACQDGPQQGEEDLDTQVGDIQWDILPVRTVEN
jgi:hypothetical protein